jgi:AmiR/NasT family two-component response regulator
MTRRLAMVQNFRGVRAVVLHLPDRNRAVLTETLGKLGLSVLALEPGNVPAEAATLDGAQLVLFDADANEVDVLPWTAGTAPIPLIAVIGLETPSRLHRAFAQLPAAVLQKPIRTTGIYTALFFAANEHRRRLEVQEQLRSLQARHGARRFVIKAVVELMRARGVDDDEAHRILRKESMRQRTTVEELAVRLVAAAGPAAGSVAAKEA